MIFSTSHCARRALQVLSLAAAALTLNRGSQPPAAPEAPSAPKAPSTRPEERAEPSAVLDLLWFEPTSMPRVRTHPARKAAPAHQW
jgi:hypothetical protein